jgi:hypothetical protein
MRSDEVTHHAEVQTVRKEGSAEVVDMAEDKAVALGQVCGEHKDIHLTKGDLGID